MTHARSLSKGLATEYIIETEERDRDEPTQSHVGLCGFALRQVSVERDRFFRIDIQSPNRIEKPRQLFFYLRWIIAV